MIALSGPNEKTIRSQVAESVSLIAELDFPERWPDLIDVRQWSRLLTPFILILLDSNLYNPLTMMISTSTSAFWKRRTRFSARGAPKLARTRFGPSLN